MSRWTFFAWAIAIALIAAPTGIQAQTIGAMSDSDYIAKIQAAAPAAVVKSAVSANRPSASRKPNRATRQTKSIVFIVGAFIVRFSDERLVAAMTIIIKFMPNGLRKRI